MLRPLPPNTVIPSDFNIYVRSRTPSIVYSIVRCDLVAYRKSYHNIVDYLSKPKNLLFVALLQAELDAMLYVLYYLVCLSKLNFISGYQKHPTSKIWEFEAKVLTLCSLNVVLYLCSFVCTLYSILLLDCIILNVL